MRTNERATAALGVSVFGLAAALAAAGGILIAFRTPDVTFVPTFDVFESIWVVLYAVTGGIGAALGAVTGAGPAPGTVGATAFSLLGETPDHLFRLFGGLLLIAVLFQDPDGLVAFYRKLALRLAARRRRRWQLTRPPSAAPPGGPGAHPAPATLTLRGLTVRFGGVTALDAVSLTVGPGEVVGLIGPNGAGKTTLIDAVTGYVTAHAGTIALDGRAIDGWSPRQRAVAGVGRLFQSLELFESLTVAENLQTACDPRDRRRYLSDLIYPGRARLAPAAVAAIRDFGLQDELASRPDELPYGRRRLVAIARAIAGGPSVLLLDEPAAGLDRGERGEPARLIRQLADERGLAVLVVEHDVSLVFQTCDRVAVLDYLVKHQITAEGWYVGNPNLTVADTKRLERIGQAADEFLDKVGDE